MRASFHGQLFICKATCFKQCRLLLFTLTWLSISGVSFLTSTNMRTICVVTVWINMANMVTIATLIDIWEQKWIAKTLLDRNKHQSSFFFYFLSLMQWLYRGMTVRPQCILPYRCSCESRQCWYSLQSRHKHGCYWGTHRYLVVVWYRYRILHRKSVCMVFTHKLVVSEIESVIILAGLRFRPAVIILVPRSPHIKYRHWSSFTCD